MLKVLLYGLATFMETGIGVWIFSQTFSERRILEKILCSRMAVVFFDFFWNL